MTLETYLHGMHWLLVWFDFKVNLKLILITGHILKMLFVDLRSCVAIQEFVKKFFCNSKIVPLTHGFSVLRSSSTLPWSSPINSMAFLVVSLLIDIHCTVRNVVTSWECANKKTYEHEFKICISFQIGGFRLLKMNSNIVSDHLKMVLLIFRLPSLPYFFSGPS